MNTRIQLTDQGSSLSIDRSGRGGGILKALGVGYLALMLAACGTPSNAEEPGPASTAVRVGHENFVVAETQEISSGPLISGSLRAEEEATIRAEVGGTVIQIFAEPGQAVRSGALLARIEDTAIRNEQLSAESTVLSAENALAVAQRDAERAAELVKEGALAERDLEVARNGVAAAKAQLAGARAQLAGASERFENTRIRAPISGVVSERQVKAGDVIAPGAALFTVIDPSSMELEAAVPSDQISALHVGAPVQFEVRGYPERTFAGTVDRISPAVDPATGQVPIWVSIPNTEGTLVAGLFAQGRVASESHEAVTAPIAAMDLTGTTPTLLRVRDGRAERVSVEVGIRDSETERIEIVSGIEPGDTLLTGAASSITPETPVRIGERASTLAEGRK